MQQISRMPKLRWWEKYYKAIKDNEQEEYCKFCGVIKKEFISPKTGKLILLECECEKKFAMLTEVLEINYELYGEDYDRWKHGKYRPSEGKNMEFHFQHLKYLEDEILEMKRKGEKK